MCCAKLLSHVQLFAIPWTVCGDSSGKNTAVGCHALLQGILPTQRSNPRLLRQQVDSLSLAPPGKVMYFLGLFKKHKRHVLYIHIKDFQLVLFQHPCSHFSTAQFSRSVVSDSLRPHGLQHARLPGPSPTPGAYSNSLLYNCILFGRVYHIQE